MDKRPTISLTIKADLWRKYRIWCLENKTSASAEFEKLIKKQLEKGKK